MISPFLSGLPWRRILSRGLPLVILAILAPLVFPELRNQLSYLCIFILLALTWDMQGGQMGYNSFGNIVFFGVGMYSCAIVQIAPFFDLAAWTEAGGERTFLHTAPQYFIGLFAGLVTASLAAGLTALLLGFLVLSLRGQYFAICTLGLAVAFGEIATNIDLIGGGSGLSVPVWPEGVGGIGLRNLLFFYLAAAMVLKLVLYYYILYRHTRFGLVLNAIRDDEDKAEAMGIQTTRYKIASWVISALFLGAAGGLVGNLVGFVDPIDVAFAGATLGIYMVIMAILGGKGTLWGPILGAVIFHYFREFFWNYFLGWQQVALGILIVVIVVAFPEGIAGWWRRSRFAAAGKNGKGAVAGQDDSAAL